MEDDTLWKVKITNAMKGTNPRTGKNIDART
jgi:hypothetical protein